MVAGVRERINELGGCARLDKTMKEFCVTRDDLRAMGLVIHRAEPNNPKSYWMVSIPGDEAGMLGSAGQAGANQIVPYLAPASLGAQGMAATAPAPTAQTSGGQIAYIVPQGQVAYLAPASGAGQATAGAPTAAQPQIAYLQQAQSGGTCNGSGQVQTVFLMQQSAAQPAGYGPQKSTGQSATRAGPYVAAGPCPMPSQSAVMMAATEEEKQNFLSRHRVEAHAVDRFLCLDPVLQKLVIVRGDLYEARDQTALLMNRITQVEKITSGQFDPASMREGDWICPVCLDHMFAKHERCRNCGTVKGQIIQPVQAPELKPATSREVFDFLGSIDVEARAEEAFLALDRRLQKAIINKGSMKDARNPTAVLTGRIEQVQKVACGQFELRPGDWLCPGCFDNQFQKNQICRNCNTPKGVAVQQMFAQQFGNANPAPEPPPPPPSEPATAEAESALAIPQDAGYTRLHADAVMATQAHYDAAQAQLYDAAQAAYEYAAVAHGAAYEAHLAQVGQNASQTPAQDTPTQGIPPSQQAILQPVTNVELFEFLSTFEVEKHAEEKFMSLDPKAQKAVINRGTMTDARNPTAVLMGRIEQVMKVASGQFELRQGDWLCPGCFDNQFQKNQNCRNCGTSRTLAISPKAQALVFGMGKDTGDIEREDFPPDPASPEEVYQFIIQHQFDEYAQAKLLQLNPVCQARVINKGGLHSARDQTAVILTRINEVKRIAGEREHDRQLRPGDWICPCCLDIQFAKNQNCRRCGTANPAPAEATPSAMQSLLDRLTEEATRAEVELFLMTHPQVQQHAKDRFLGLDPKLQKLVINKGSMTNVRDQTAVLLGRIGQVTKMASGAALMDMKAGNA